MAMTLTEKRQRRQQRQESQARIEKAQAETRAVVASGKCPVCGAGVHKNLSLTGLWKCNRSGSGSFRRDPTGSHCDWQGFTHS